MTKYSCFHALLGFRNNPKPTSACLVFFPGMFSSLSANEVMIIGRVLDGITSSLLKKPIPAEVWPHIEDMSVGGDCYKLKAKCS